MGFFLTGVLNVETTLAKLRQMNGRYVKIICVAGHKVIACQDNLFCYPDDGPEAPEMFSVGKPGSKSFPFIAFYPYHVVAFSDNDATIIISREWE